MVGHAEGRVQSCPAAPFHPFDIIETLDFSGVSYILTVQNGRRLGSQDPLFSSAPRTAFCASYGTARARAVHRKTELPSHYAGSGNCEGQEVSRCATAAAANRHRLTEICRATPKWAAVSLVRSRSREASRPGKWFQAEELLPKGCSPVMVGGIASRRSRAKSASTLTGLIAYENKNAGPRLKAMAT
jgi:hypothetical protein